MILWQLPTRYLRRSVSWTDSRPFSSCWWGGSLQSYLLLESYSGSWHGVYWTIVGKVWRAK